MIRRLLLTALLCASALARAACPTFFAGDLDYISKLNQLAAGCATTTATLPTAAASGTVNAITAIYSPAITLSDKQLALFVSSGANTSTTPTFAPNGLTAHTITTRGGTALLPGDIGPAGFVAFLEYNLASTRWELLNPMGDRIPVAAAGGTVDAITATFVPPVTLADKTTVMVISAGVNTITTPTFAPNGLTAHTITARGGAELNAGDIGDAGYVGLLQYNLANTRWELLNPAASSGSSGSGIPSAGAGGTVDAITATFSPAITLIDKQTVMVVSAGENTSTTPSFAPNGLTAHTITARGGSALAVGDIGPAGFVMLMQYNLGSTRWELLNPVGSAGSGGSTSSLPIAAGGGTVDVITATYSPPITLTDKQQVMLISAGANTSATPTFSPNSLTAHTITARGGQALVAGDIGPSGFVALLEYNSGGTRWELVNPVRPTPYLLSAQHSITLTGGASGASPTPPLKFGSFSDNAGNPSISHIDLWGGLYGIGVSDNYGQTYFSNGIHSWFTGGATSPPMMTLHDGYLRVGPTTVTINSGDPAIAITRSVSGSSATNAHAFTDSSAISRTGSGMAYASYDARVAFSGTNNYDHYAGFQHAPNLSFSGTITHVYAFASLGSPGASATITNRYGLWAGEHEGTGTVVNNYGSYCQPLIKGTNNYCIYMESTSAASGRYFLYSPGTVASYMGGALTVIGRLSVGTASPLLGSFNIGTVGGTAGTHTQVMAHIVGANAITNAAGLLTIHTNDSQAADKGGSIGFGGYYTGTTAVTWAQIAGRKENSTDGQTGGYLSFGTRANGGNILENMRLTSLGQLIVGGTTATRSSTSPWASLTLGDSTFSPFGTISNATQLFTVAGELYVMDAAGNSTQLSPHDSEGNWIYNSAGGPGGNKHLRIEMEKLLKALNRRFGWNYVHEHTIERTGEAAKAALLDHRNKPRGVKKSAPR